MKLTIKPQTEPARPNLRNNRGNSEFGATLLAAAIGLVGVAIYQHSTADEVRICIESVEAPHSISSHNDKQGPVQNLGRNATNTVRDGGLHWVNQVHGTNPDEDFIVTSAYTHLFFRPDHLVGELEPGQEYTLRVYGLDSQDQYGRTDSNRNVPNIIGIREHHGACR